MQIFLKKLFEKSLIAFIVGGMFLFGVYAAASIPGTCTTPGNCNELQTTLKSLVLKTTLTFTDSDGSNTTLLQSADTVNTNISFKLPSTQGTANQILATDGAGNFIWKANPNTKRIGEFVFKKSNYYASDAAAIADGYLPVKSGTITNGKNLYPIWAAKNTEFVSGNDIVFPSNVNGMFLRNVGGNATTEGNFQADGTAANGLGGSTSTNGNHSHSHNAPGTGGNFGLIRESNGGNNTPPSGDTSPGEPDIFTSPEGLVINSGGDHSHSLSITSSDTETRPDNRAYQLYTIIDTY